MFMNVGYTPPPPVWPPKTSTTAAGLGLYLRQNFPTPQRLIAPLNSAQIEIPDGWGACTPGMSAYEPQNFVTPQRLAAVLQSAQIEIPKGWGMGAYERQNFVTPQRLIAALQSAGIEIPNGWGSSSGMGCCSSCASGGTCQGHSHGMGQLFESTDLSDWGPGEWVVIGLGGLGAIFAISSLFKAGSAVSSYSRKQSRAAKKRAQAQALLAGA
jgi:hypothetical protein